MTNGGVSLTFTYCAYSQNILVDLTIVGVNNCFKSTVQSLQYSHYSRRQLVVPINSPRICIYSHCLTSNIYCWVDCLIVWALIRYQKYILDNKSTMKYSNVLLSIEILAQKVSQKARFLKPWILASICSVHRCVLSSVIKKELEITKSELFFENISYEINTLPTSLQSANKSLKADLDFIHLR